MGAGNSYYTLSQNPEQLADTIQTHAAREEVRLRYRRMMWVISWWYLNGARRFDVFDMTTGAVVANYVDQDGRLEFQSQELLHTLNKMASRLAAMDYRPRVNNVGGSLQGVRERATAQVLLDSLVKHDQLLQASRLFAWTLVSLGSCGVIGHLTDHPTIGLMSDTEVVHPREVMPFPSINDSVTSQRGMMRSRDRKSVV